jgi:hypothetical protein
VCQYELSAAYPAVRQREGDDLGLIKGAVSEAPQVVATQTLGLDLGPADATLPGWLRRFHAALTPVELPQVTIAQAPRSMGPLAAGAGVSPRS